MFKRVLRGGLSMPSALIMALMRPQSGSACGAARRKRLRAPDSSLSQCEKPIQRRRSTGSSAAIASETSGKSCRPPV